MRQVYINLPVSNLERSMDFYQHLGFSYNTTFSGKQQKCMVWSDHIYVMLISNEQYIEWNAKPIPDAQIFSATNFTLPVESIERVNEIVNMGLKGGGKEPVPMLDDRYLQLRRIEDPDGHTWGVMYLDMVEFRKMQDQNTNQFEVMKDKFSSDDAMIAYERLGNGQGLIIVGGSLADHSMYHPLALELSKHFTVYNYDRRNRGMSDSTEVHNVETELKDLEHLMAISSDSKILYGHSAGAALAIKAAVKGLRIEKLVLSDLPFSTVDDDKNEKSEKYQREYDQIRKLIEAGNKEGAVRYFLKDFGMSEEDLDGFFASENGQESVTIAHTLLVDYEILGDGLTPVDLLQQISLPTLILTTDQGELIAKDAAMYLRNSSIKVLDNPTYMSSPQDVAKPIIDFLNEQ